MELAEVRRHIVDVARESKYQYWQSLLTLCGILISVFSVASVFSPEKRVFLAALATLPMVAAFLLIKCFRDTQDIALNNISLADNPTKANVDSAYADAYSKHSDGIRREHIVEGILCLEAIVIILMLVSP